MALNELAQLALLDDLETVYARASEAVVQMLGLQFAGVLELLSDGRMIVRSGHGVPEHLRGAIASTAEPGSQPAFVLGAGEVVVVEDMPAESRFEPAATLLGEEVRSGLTAAIPGTAGPIGTFGAWTREQRSFASEEIELFALVSNGLGLAASRARLARRLETQRAASEALAMSETMSEAAPRFLEAICGSLGWAAGILWLVEPGGERMRAVDVWLDEASGERERSFARNELEHTTFTVGERLPGRAWEAGEPQWISEIPADTAHPKVRPALDAGLRSVLVFPIKRGEEVLGVVEVLGREITEPDEELLEDCQRFGRKVGEFIAREQAQAQVRESRDELELVLQHMPVGVTVVDPAGRYRFVNEVTARINGATPDQLIGVSVIDAIAGLTIYDEDGVEMDRGDLPLFKALRGEPSPSQLVQFAGPAVSEQRWAIAHAIPLPGPLGDPRAVISVVENVTDLKSAEARLRASEARYREIADTLQRGLLPPDAGKIAGLDLDARLHTEEAGTRIGGDFYDVFQVSGDRYAIVIGDVSGKGVGAAGLTALARHTIRTAAMHDPRPSQVLRTLNRALLRAGSDEQYLTAVYALVEPVAEGHDVLVAAGGHPAPLHVRADGEVTEVDAHGTLLGFFEELELFEAGVRLRPDDAMVLFTDGITEAGFRDESPGAPVTDEALRGLLSTCGGESATRIADRIEARVLTAEGGELRDDATMVVVASRAR
ncbi:MAG TPA: SpoIIE family protein phosphatase [Solirubrobacterales bacterium]